MGYIDQPSKTINIIRSQDAIVDQLGEHRVLVVGHLSGSSPFTVLPEKLYYDVPNSESDIDSLFGRSSHIAGMLRAFKRTNKLSPVDAYPFPSTGPGALPSTGTIELVGASTEDGFYDIVVGSKKDCSVRVNIPSGTLGEDAITLIYDAISPLLLSLPLSATTTTTQVLISTTMDSSIGNYFDIELRGYIAGISSAAFGFDGGGAFPLTPGTDVVDAISGRRYQTIVWPVSYEASNIVDEMDSRFNANFGILDGVLVQTKVETLANVKAYADDFNSNSFVVIWNSAIDRTSIGDVHIGGAIIEMPDIISSKFAALRSLRLTEGSNLTPYISTSAPLDQFGGASLASLPYFNTIVPDIATPLNTEFPGFEDIEEANGNGASVIGPNSAFNTTLLGEMVTTYLVDPVSGDPDPSYKFLNTIDTVSAIRELVSINCARRYSQTRLTQGVLIPRRDMANEKSIRAFLNEVYDELANLTLVASGSDAKRDFNETLVVTVDIGAQKATIDMQPLLVTQLRAIVGTIAVNFGG